MPSTKVQRLWSLSVVGCRRSCRPLGSVQPVTLVGITDAIVIAVVVYDEPSSQVSQTPSTKVQRLWSLSVVGVSS